MLLNDPSTGFDKNVCKKILEYLMAQKDHRDDLDGILLGVYEKELERISQETLRNLRYLISLGVVEEEKNCDGTIWYKMAGNSQKVSELIKKFG